MCQYALVDQKGVELILLGETSLRVIAADAKASWDVVLMIKGPRRRSRGYIVTLSDMPRIIYVPDS